MFKHTPPVYIPVEPEGNGIFVPLLMSALVHVLIIAFVFFTHRVPDIEIPQSIETSIITQAELEAIEARIGENRSAKILDAQNANQPDDSATTADTSPDTLNDVDIDIDFDEFVDEIYRKPKPPKPINNSDTPATSLDPSTQGLDSDNSLITSVDQMADSNGYDDMALSEKERLYQEKMAKYAADLDAEMQAQQQQIINDRNLSDAQREALVEEYKQRAENLTPNRNQNSGRIRVDIPPAQQTNNNLAGSMGGARAITPKPNEIDKGAIKNQLEQLIYSRWSPPAGSTGKQITAIVKVNNHTGQVINVSITGADNILLEQSLEDAIYAGALTPVIGTNLQTIRLVLIAK